MEPKWRGELAGEGHYVVFDPVLGMGLFTLEDGRMWQRQGTKYQPLTLEAWLLRSKGFGFKYFGPIPSVPHEWAEDD